ncbi:MAG: response regulator transcription factor [Bacteroidetes bacterium]|nr:MAG: response regulator transcription factor [Bacteroidota bacterium]
MKPQILLADDHQLMREGLRKLLEEKKIGDVIAEAENGSEAMRLTRERSPNIVIMDVSMPDINGIEATRQIKLEFPLIKIIALSMHTDERRVLEMLQAGASAYVLKDSSFRDIANAIDSVLLGKTFISPTVGGNIIKTSLEQLKPVSSQQPINLTPAERQVIKLIAEGKSNKEIADILNIGIKTVETHRQHIMDKLNLHTIAELTKYAIREGMTEL